MNKVIIKAASVFVLLGVVAANIAPVSVRAADANTFKTRYESAKNQYLREVNAYKTTRQQLMTAKATYQKIKNSDNKKAYETQIKTFLGKTIDVLVAKLESLKVWVSNRGLLSEADKQAIAADIDQDITELNSIRAGIETATPEQAKEKAKQLEDFWKNHQVSVKRIIGQIWAARLSYMVTAAENFAAKAETKIQELKAAGNDTTQLEAWLADFNQKVATAKQKIESAESKFKAISTPAQADQFFKEGHQFIKDANKYIRDAYTTLVKIVRDMKKMGKTVETPTPQPTATVQPTAQPVNNNL